MGMDRVIDQREKRWWYWIAGAAVVLALAWLLFSGAGSDKAYTVDGQRLSIATVEKGIFQDYIPLRAAVEPLKTVYLDAIEGGRVERVLVEEGAIVQQGDALLELSNTTLQLDVIAREAEVSEQLNNLRNTQLAIEQNRLSLRGDLIEIDYQIVRLERQIKRLERITEAQLMSRDELENATDELRYWQARREVTQASQAQDEKLRVAQINQLESSIEQLEQNLTIARANLDNLRVLAPRSGKLTSLDAEIGESKARGQRLGQIDDIDQFKASALVNEFYINRVRLGQTAEATVGGQARELQVSKIYPEVRNGQFEVDLTFAEGAPQDIRRGQTLQLNLSLGDQVEAILLENGPFFQDTGGAWAFVLTPAGDEAYRRRLQLGRRNPAYIEVESGLVPGDRVVISQYTGLQEIDRLRLTR